MGRGLVVSGILLLLVVAIIVAISATASKPVTTDKPVRGGSRPVLSPPPIPVPYSDSPSHTPDSPTREAREETLISREQAIAIATSYLGGGNVVDFALQYRKHGLAVYEVTFDRGSVVYVSARKQQVVYAIIRDDDDDAEDEDQDDDE